MKVALAAVNAKYIHSNLAVYSLRANAGVYRDQIALREYTINQQEDVILKDLYDLNPSICFFSCYIWNISFVKQIIEDLHQILPHMPIWVGGPEVSYEAGKFLEENPALTGVLVGEGEVIFRNLLHYYDTCSCLSDSEKIQDL